MTSRINYNMVSQKKNPYLTKIMFYTKKHNALIFQENLELFIYFKKLLRFYKLKKNLPSYGLKIKRSSLNNIYFFTIFEGDSLTKENLFQTFLKYKKTLKKRKFFQNILVKQMKTRFIKQYLKKNFFTLNLKVKKNKKFFLNNFLKKTSLLKLKKIKKIFKKETSLKKFKNVKNLNQNSLITKKIKIYRKKNLVLRKFIKLKKFFFNKIKKNFLLRLKNYTNLFNFNKKLNYILRYINLQNILNFEQLFKILNSIKKKKKFIQFKYYKSKKLKKLNYILNNKSKSKFIKKSNKYLSIPRSLEFSMILKNLLLSNVLIKSQTKKYFKTLINYKNSSKTLISFLKNKNDKKLFNILLNSKRKNQNNLQKNLILLNSKILNNLKIKKHNFNKIFCYKLLIQDRLNFFNKIQLFENELKFTFNIKFSNLKIVYQRIFDLNNKIMNKLNVILPFSEIPEQYEYSRLKILLKEGILTQNFTKFETVLKRTIRRQHSKRLLNFAKDIITVLKTIFYEIYLKNLYIFSQYNDEETFLKGKNLEPFLFKTPQVSFKKVPFSVSFQYRGKLKKDGRKQRFSFFVKNPYYLNLFNLTSIKKHNFKYEQTASQFFAHFKRGGVGGFKLLINYIYV